MEVATEQYGFCPDIVDQEQDEPTVGNLAEEEKKTNFTLPSQVRSFSC